jgi:hypothetical protein
MPDEVKLTTLLKCLLENEVANPDGRFLNGFV